MLLVLLLLQVCFHMYLPRLLAKFLYCHRFNSGNLLLDKVMLLASKEMHCCATMCRNFFWTRKCLGREGGEVIRSYFVAFLL